ncbi:PREDICTED: uncharacterized serine/threonine-protein kinase SgK494 [Gavialis gangeticus]|uniref:uncharacterized serine/threonine-protein kinase SgK494 n=1 Tax=Gavialis gangeticus TaxID=94835 RepID=UPI00092F04C3|nr:PREDICTED: uncharacterized serine/threonine-protein kinase SgK494 [Gavialis gangeticus]
MGSAVPGWVRAGPPQSRSQQVTPAPLALQGGGVAAEPAWPRSWKRVLCRVGSAVSGLERVLVARTEGAESPRGPVPTAEQLPRLVQKVVSEWPLPQCVALFLPEFPVRPPIHQQQLKVLGFVAKGSFGTVLKVLDCRRETVVAVKVVPKVEVLRRDTLKQCKEEVSIQRRVQHPFVHCLGDSWQGQRHLFIMCTYCSTGDLHTLWAASGHLEEVTVRLFAAELILVLGYLHDLGIVHRDVKMENILLDARGHLKLTDFGLSRHLPRGERAYTICGTLQYMAPEVLSGGPYTHAADWWSLGVVLFTLATGQFPVAPERDHVAMLASVTRCSYAVPPSLSRALSLLLSELLCRNPLQRPRHLHHFKAHPFFRGVTFRDAGTSVTPVSAASAGTGTTPRALLERGTNTSGAGPRRAKDSAAETDSLLWQCFREQLSSLSRSELEGRLESTLIIVEALSYQLQGWQQRQGPAPGVGPAEQRDVPTQTDLACPGAEERFYHDLYLESRERVQTLQRHRESEQALRQAVQQATGEMRSWALESRAFLDFTATSLQHLQTDRQALGQEREQLRALLSRCRSSLEGAASKLQRCLEERDEARRRQGEALQAKEAGDAVLEELRCHAGARICCSELGLAAQRELRALLEGARRHQASWALESESFLEFATVSLFMLQDDRRALGQGQEQLRALLSRGRSSLEGVASKLQRCLEERDEARRREGEALQATTAVSSRLEEVTAQREAALAALQDSVAQVEQLTTASSRLGTELSATVRELAVVEVERDQLQEENTSYTQETARLRQEQEALQQEHDRLRQELWEMTECHEFIDQENRVSRAQLLETEHKLKSTLATLRERSMQHEELQDAYHGLKMEESALRQELKACQAQLQDLQLKRDEVLKSSSEIARGTDQLLGLARALRAAQQEEADGALSWSRACTPARQTPHRLHTSFVGSVLKAMAGKDPDGDGIGVGSAFAKVEPAAPQKPAEAEASLLERVQELRHTIADLVAASSLAQEAEQERAQALQAEIVDLKQQLETLGAELDARDASIAKLNKVLRVKLQSEKELQEVVQQQEEKMLQLIDRSGEVTSLKTEVSQLQRALQRAETEAKVLWEEVRGQQPPADTSNVQEKVWLRQEVNKLRELLLEKGNEISLLSSKYLEQRRILEGRLHQVQKVLKSQEETEEKVKEALLSIPDVVATSSQELQDVLRYLGLKPAAASECPAATL